MVRALDKKTKKIKKQKEKKGRKKTYFFPAK